MRFFYLVFGIIAPCVLLALIVAGTLTGQLP